MIGRSRGGRTTKIHALCDEQGRPHDTDRYKLRTVVERTFHRIKDFRGIATRYDKTARNFLAAVYLVSAITYWA